jgi:hypothetical protein
VVAPTIAWSDDSQIVSTVADAALAVAHAGGPLPPTRSCLSAMRLFKGSHFSRWVAIARSCRPERGDSMSRWRPTMPPKCFRAIPRASLASASW